MMQAQGTRVNGQAARKGLWRYRRDSLLGVILWSTVLEGGQTEWSMERKNGAVGLNTGPDGHTTIQDSK